MLRVVATNGEAVLVADGDVGASVLPDGSYLVAPVGSLLAQSDWEPASGPVPGHLPARAVEEISALKAAR